MGLDPRPLEDGAPLSDVAKVVDAARNEHGSRAHGNVVPDVRDRRKSRFEDFAEFSSSGDDAFGRVFGSVDIFERVAFEGVFGAA